jgi:outer membrane protein TolC
MTAAHTLLDGMSAEQRQRAAEAGLDRAAALYRSAVVTAFQNVADVLQAIALYRAAEQGASGASQPGFDAKPFKAGSHQCFTGV